MTHETSNERTMSLSKEFVDFNKELLFGEIGALIGIPLFPFLVSHFTHDPGVISSAAVIGGMVTGSCFWLVVKIGDEKGHGRRAARHLARKIAYFTPAAFVLGLLTYQPTVFFVSRWLIVNGDNVVYAALFSQALAFMFFLAAMNLYRLVIHRLTTEWI